MENPLGRPARKSIESLRTRVWAHAVCVRAGRTPKRLADVLGPEDGKWGGLWSRYIRGLATPKEDRRQRIEAKLPGVDRYYASSLWELIEERDFNWTELRGCVDALPKLIRDGFIHDARHAATKGKFWRNEYDRSALLGTCRDLVSDQKFGLDALTAILLLLREAELMQNCQLYLEALIAWSHAERECRSHLVLRALTTDLFVLVAEPIRRLRFGDLGFDDLHADVLSAYRERTETTRGKFDVLDYLRSDIVKGVYLFSPE